MRATLLILFEAFVRLLFAGVFVYVLWLLSGQWLGAVWVAAFARTSELVALALFCGGIVFLIFVGFLWWWGDRRISGFFDRLDINRP